ncbi:lysophospholipid acyltransferase family protein [bacterium]|nr:lysophospholipid acyltransferase family protein [bacterium]
MAKKSKIQEKAEVAIANFFIRIFQRLEHRTALKVGGIIGVIFHDLVGIRKRHAVEEIRKSFPERSERWAQAVVRELYRHLGMHGAEVARFPVLRDEIDKWVVMEGAENVEKVHQMGKGCIAVVAHLGAWEWAGAWTAAKGYPVTYIVAKQSNSAIEELIDDHRKVFGVKIVKRENGTREAIRALRDNNFLAVMLDQDGGDAGAFVPFFGRKASTFRGAAVLALKLNSPIIFIANHRLPDGRVHIALEHVEVEPSGDREKDIVELTAMLTGKIEAEIRKNPHEWLWLHRRWKTPEPTE